jgi:hypothetical protein
MCMSVCVSIYGYGIIYTHTLALLHYILCKQVIRVCHCLELEVVVKRVFEKHCVLLAGLPLEPDIYIYMYVCVCV